MKRSTITLAAALMLTAVALKLAFPAGSSKVIRSVQDSASPNDPKVSTNIQVDTPLPVTTVTINAAEFLGKETADLDAASLPEAVEEAVETFLADQAPFNDLAIPANVSYEVDLPSFDFVKPVTARCSSGFGYRVHPLENLTKFHYGADLAAQSGDDIVSFAKGTVSEVGEDEVHGKYICIDHEDGFETMYAHCGTVYVSRGQAVSAGEKIALVGSTGKVTGPHLHFEVKHNGVYLNPEFYLAAV